MSDFAVHVTRYRDRTNLVLYYVDPITEKRITRSAGTANEREAERAAAEWESDLRSDRQSDERITWEAFRDRVEDEKLPAVAPGTRKTYAAVMNSVELHLAPARLAAVGTPAAIAQYVASLRKGKGNRKPLCETTIAGYLRHLHALLVWAKGQGLLRAVPAFPKFRTGTRNAAMRGRPITPEEFDRFLAAAPRICLHHTPTWQQYIQGLWWSGLRLSESLALSWDQDEPFCVDLSGRRPMFRIYSEAQKSRRDQLHPMAPEFAEFLVANYPPQSRTGPVFQLPDPKTDDILTTSWSVSKIVADIGREAKIVVSRDGFASAHDLRRSFGLRWAKRVKVHVLRAMMRHRSINTTMAYYVREDANDLAESIWSAHSTFHSTNADFHAEKTSPANPTNPAFSNK